MRSPQKTTCSFGISRSEVQSTATTKEDFIMASLSCHHSTHSNHQRSCFLHRVEGLKLRKIFVCPSQIIIPKVGSQHGPFPIFFMVLSLLCPSMIQKVWLSERLIFHRLIARKLQSTLQITSAKFVKNHQVRLQKNTCLNRLRKCNKRTSEPSCNRDWIKKKP